MLTDYERHLLNTYLANIAASLAHCDPVAQVLTAWVSDREKHIAFPAGRRRRRHAWHADSGKSGLSGKKLRKLEKFLRNECTGKAADRDRTVERLHGLGQTTGLGQADIDILELLLRYNTHPVFGSMIDAIFEHPNIGGRALPMALGLPANTVQLRLKSDAPLVRSGLVKIDEDGDLTPFRRLHRIVTEPGGGGIDATRLLLDAASPGQLAWQDFDHVAPDRDHVGTLVKGALAGSIPGVNILLHGPPGTGKTEFCKVLAEELGADLYIAGEADEDGGEPTRGERLQELRLAQNLLAGNRRSLLLFDEMEDLLDAPFGGFEIFGPKRFGRTRGAASKVFMHRLLENSPVPVLWTTNDARDFSPAILRRMMFAVELRLPTAPVRARVWSRQLDLHGIKAGPEEVRMLAAEFDAAPGIAAGVTAAASLAGGDLAAVHRGVRSLSRLLSCGKPPQGAPSGFDPELMRADIDAAALAGQLEDAGTRRFSLCLQGPPGTGKSAYVRFLAERLGLEVLQKRASDLLSMWVGETEKSIARAFAQARDKEAFLVFDEADSLLADRRSAQRNWEVSQVNEMLAWMENHPLPFACTTNFGKHLDPATLRRFVFKIALGYLAPEQVETAFRSYFDLPPPASLARLDTLAPGDFPVVHRKAGILGRLQDPEALAAMLRAECEAKPGRPQAIGFLH